MFDLGSMVNAGMNFLFGSPGQPTGKGPPIGPGLGQPTSGLIGTGGSFNVSGFIKKGASSLLKTQGLGASGADSEGRTQIFQTTEMGRPRSIQQLTRGRAVGQVELPAIQQRMYSAPEVRAAAQRLMASQNNHMRNLRAAAGLVDPTLRSGRRTIATETPELAEIDVT